MRELVRIIAAVSEPPIIITRLSRTVTLFVVLIQATLLTAAAGTISRRLGRGWLCGGTAGLGGSAGRGLRGSGLAWRGGELLWSTSRRTSSCTFLAEVGEAMGEGLWCALCRLG